MSFQEEVEILKKRIADLESGFKLVAYARINEKGDLFDLRLQNNPYIDQNTVIPLFRFLGEIK